MGENSKVVCEICGQLIDKRGMRMHKGTKACLDAAKNKKPGQEQHTNKKCDAVNRTEHEFRLLKSNIPNEARAISMGYKLVCIHCDELGK